MTDDQQQEEQRTRASAPTGSGPSEGPDQPPTPPEMDDPFRRGGTSGGARRRSRLAWGLGGGLALAAAAVGVVLATRGRGDEDAPTPAGHAHGAAAQTSAGGQPVMLTADRARRIGVTYAPVVSAPLAQEVRTVAQVTYDETRVKTIAPKVEGWVEQLYVNATGQPVSVGQPLLSIYSPMLVTAQQELLLADRLAHDVAGGTADAKSGAADLRESARRRLLYWDISPAQIDRLERTGEVQKTLTLRASANGVVVDKAVLAGQRIMAGDALYKVADLSTVWLEGEVFERDLAAVRVGQSVRATFEALPGEERAGRITYVYPTLNPETRTARVRVAMANPGLRLKPGMYATLLIASTARGDVISVPRSAVLATGTRTLVFVRRPDGSLEPRDVAVGASSAERTEILRGVVPGDTVVASATFLVDAESNLGSALGGMGNMPGMDMGTPDAKRGVEVAPAARPAAPVRSQPAAAPMPGMPGMEAPRPTSPKPE